MNPRSKGLGFLGYLILLACFLVVRVAFESVLHESDSELNRHINAAVLAIAGVLTFALAVRLDQTNGIKVFSVSAWTSGFFESQHIMLYLPLRAIGVIYFAASFFF
jgi:hypothetical protein